MQEAVLVRACLDWSNPHCKSTNSEPGAHAVSAVPSQEGPSCAKGDPAAPGPHLPALGTAQSPSVPRHCLPSLSHATRALQDAAGQPGRWDMAVLPHIRHSCEPHPCPAPSRAAPCWRWGPLPTPTTPLFQWEGCGQLCASPSSGTRRSRGSCRHTTSLFPRDSSHLPFPLTETLGSAEAPLSSRQRWGWSNWATGPCARRGPGTTPLGAQGPSAPSSPTVPCSKPQGSAPCSPRTVGSCFTACPLQSCSPEFFSPKVRSIHGAREQAQDRHSFSMI